MVDIERFPDHVSKPAEDCLHWVSLKLLFEGGLHGFQKQLEQDNA
jgi:hypothetical protein